MSDNLAEFDLAQELRNADSRKPWQSGLYSKTLVKKDDLRVVLFVMEAGAILREHCANGSITVHVLQGEICFLTQGQNRALRAGQLLSLGRSIHHAVESGGVYARWLPCRARVAGVVEAGETFISSSIRPTGGPAATLHQSSELMPLAA